MSDLTTIDLADWLKATDGLENACPDPACKDHNDHAPGTAITFPKSDPITRLLRIPKGGH